MNEEIRLRFAAKMILRSRYADGVEEEVGEFSSKLPTLGCSTKNCGEPSDYYAVENNQHSFESIKLNKQCEEPEKELDERWRGLGDEHYARLGDEYYTELVDEWTGLGGVNWFNPTGPYWTPELDTYEPQEFRGGEGGRMIGEERWGGEDEVKYRWEWYRGERVNHLPRWQTVGVAKRQFATTAPAPPPSLLLSRGDTSIPNDSSKPFHTLLSPAIKNHSSEKMGVGEETEVREAGPTDKEVDENEGREAEDGRADDGERVEERDSDDGERVKRRDSDDDERVKGRDPNEERNDDNVAAQAETLVKVVMGEATKTGQTSPSRQPNYKDKKDRVGVWPSLRLAPVRSLVSLYTEVGTKNLTGFFNPRKIIF